MNDTSKDSTSRTASDAGVDDTHVRERRRKREILFVVSALIFGFAVVPALIYGVGNALLGAYAGTGTAFGFYGQFFGNLIHGVFRTWLVALSPLALLYGLRVIFRDWSHGVSQSPESQSIEGESAQGSSKSGRREPFVAP